MMDQDGSGAAEFSGEAPLLKVGILSDIQYYDQPSDWAYGNLEKALAMLAARQPDVLVIAGDLVESAGHEDEFSSYRPLLKRYFGAAQPPLVVCAGNHDVSCHPPRPLRESLDIFCRNLDIPRESPASQTVGGYDFITVHEEGADEYGDDTLAGLAALLDKAVKRAPDRPVFVVTHYPPFDTVPASALKPRMVKLRELLDRYPQAVSLSGHTHCPLEDERSIWQQEFTALNTATLSYGCLDVAKFFNCCNGILPFAREVVQMMVLEIYADRMVFRRFQVEEGREIKPEDPWVVDIPYRPSAARYTASRAAARKAPEFPAGAQLFLRYDYGFAYVVFDCAVHEDMVFAYHVRVAAEDADGRWRERGSVDYAANFYRLERNRDKREFFKLPADLLKSGAVNRIEVYPMEPFGKTGAPLCVERSVPAWWQYRPVDPDSAPQE